MTRKILLSLHEASQIYGLPYCALKRWAKSGELANFKSGRRTYTTPGAIEHFLNSKEPRETDREII